MLDVVGKVEIDFGDSRGYLVADGQQLVLDVEAPSALIGVIDLGSLRALAEGLTRAGFTLRVRSGGQLLLLAGREARTGVISRVLRLPDVQMSPRFAFRSAFARVPLARRRGG